LAGGPRSTGSTGSTGATGSTRSTGVRGVLPTLSLAVQYAAGGADLPTRAQARRWLRRALERPAAITLRFVDEAEGRALNATYRGRDYATNVLTFVYSEPGARAALAGDIVVCVPVVHREAARQRRRVAAHFAHLVIHGALHLQGYDHETAADAARMEMRETAILGKFGIPDPYRS
jgi:probable rRNA maturation factor